MKLSWEEKEYLLEALTDKFDEHDENGEHDDLVICVTLLDKLKNNMKNSKNTATTFEQISNEELVGLLKSIVETAYYYHDSTVQEEAKEEMPRIIEEVLNRMSE